jgi:mono/diheme cytochrome c family protein
MHDQPVLEPFEASDFFADGRGGRMPIEGTVARGALRDDEAFYTGLAGDQFLAELPLANTRELLERGHERFDIFCSPCHSRTGDGRGMIVRRGFKQPASFHEARLRDQPVGYYFDVMSRGFGEMSSYASLIRPADRWAIAAYIRALQLSQKVVLADLDVEDRTAIEEKINAQSTAAAGETAAINEETAAHD